MTTTWWVVGVVGYAIGMWGTAFLLGICDQKEGREWITKCDAAVIVIWPLALAVLLGISMLAIVLGLFWTAVPNKAQIVKAWYVLVHPYCQGKRVGAKIFSKEGKEK